MSPQKKKDLTFAELVSSIHQAHDLFSAQASKAVNISLTLRNWFIGMYITEYELHGLIEPDTEKIFLMNLLRNLPNTM